MISTRLEDQETETLLAWHAAGVRHLDDLARQWATPGPASEARKTKKALDPARRSLVEVTDELRRRGVEIDPIPPLDKIKHAAKVAQYRKENA
jgi:hypothetical protein